MGEQRNIPADLVEIGTLARSPRHPWRNPRQLLCRLAGTPARGCGVSSGWEQTSQKDGDRHRPYAPGDAADPVCRGPDRTAAEFLRGQTLLIPESALPELDEDEVYLHDMLGLSVVLDATGQKLGVLDHVLFHGEQELWSILTPEGKDILLPAVPEFVADIDLDTEIIRITPPEGLLELYM